MIETDEDEREAKRITPVVQEDLERAVASLSVKERREFVILTPAKLLPWCLQKLSLSPNFSLKSSWPKA